MTEEESMTEMLKCAFDADTEEEVDVIGILMRVYRADEQAANAVEELEDYVQSHDLTDLVLALRDKKPALMDGELGIPSLLDRIANVLKRRDPRIRKGGLLRRLCEAMDQAK